MNEEIMNEELEETEPSVSEELNDVYYDDDGNFAAGFAAGAGGVLLLILGKKAWTKWGKPKVAAAKRRLVEKLLSKDDGSEETDGSND